VKLREEKKPRFSQSAPWAQTLNWRSPIF
jgi:hypothetical protein